jgi:DNA replicative helicase MCM subunit Mcm2 (Cdc46/Mcm family)
MTDADGKERWFCKDDGEWEMHVQRQHNGEAKEVGSANFKAAEVDMGSSQAEIALDTFRKLCGPENKGATEAEALAELKKAGIEEPEGAKLIESLKRNGQIYESSPGRFSVTKS